jgi:hypothetical protein
MSDEQATTQSKIYIIEQYDECNGFFGIQGIYKTLERAQLVLKCLMKYRTFVKSEKRCDCVAHHVQVNHIHSYVSKHQKIEYRLIEVLM